MPLKSVCVYCGSHSGSRPIYTERAVQLGQHLANNGIAVVYGGGNVGLMGTLADATLAAGGEVIGVIPESPEVLQSSNAGVPVILDDMSQAGQAYTDAVARILGQEVPLRFTTVERKGFFSKMFGG